MPGKALWMYGVLCTVLCTVLSTLACKKEPSGLPNSYEMMQKMGAREKALSSFSIEVYTEEAGAPVEHKLWFRAPELMRIEVKQPQQMRFSFDGQNHYALNPLSKKLTILSLQLSTAERKIALSKLLGAFVPEGFQVPKVVPKNLKQSWLHTPSPQHALRLENHVSDGKDAANIVYVVRWPSLDFLKKEVVIEGHTVEFSMQEEHCMPEHHLCLPSVIAAQREGEAPLLQKIKLLSLQEALSNEQFILEAPEGFSVERHSFSSLKELELFLGASP
ncbi:MAG: hypothetical protein FWG75_03750 [Cystobacterineae bacterium]|nr:hypothetical protein [Cystobacterineae bacterium]